MLIGLQTTVHSSFLLTEPKVSSFFFIHILKKIWIIISGLFNVFFAAAADTIHLKSFWIWELCSTETKVVGWAEIKSTKDAELAHI